MNKTFVSPSNGKTGIPRGLRGLLGQEEPSDPQASARSQHRTPVLKVILHKKLRTGIAAGT